MKDQDDESISKLDGDGGPIELTETQLTLLKKEVDDIAKDSSEFVWVRRTFAADTRFARWEGQASDGKKHRVELGGKDPFPFEGASDGRIRLADGIINERVAILVTAATRMIVECMGMEGQDEGFAKRIQTMIKYVIRNQLGSRWRRELTKLAQYQEGDSPGCGMLGIYWDRQYGLETKIITLEGVVKAFIAIFGDQVQESDLVELAEMLKDPERDDESAQFFMNIAPALRQNKKRALKIVKELREKGEAEFPAPYLAINCPDVCAHRPYEDIFIPTDTTELQRSRVVFVTELLDDTELAEKETSEDWSATFIEEVKKHKGEITLPSYYRELMEENPSGDGSLRFNRLDSSSEKEKYEIIYAYLRVSNKDGIPGLFYVPFHGAVKTEAARPLELLDDKTGKFPFVFFPRETLTKRLFDTRGVPELAMTHQTALKLMHDAEGDYVSLTTVPPLKVPAQRGRLDLVIGPLVKIKEKRQGEISWMNPPIKDRSNVEMMKEIRRQLDEYFGRPNPENAAYLAQILTQFMIDNFLDYLKDAIMLMIQLCQQNYTDQDIQRITGSRNFVVIRSREEIQGKFDITLSFDAKDLDSDWLVKKIGMMTQILQFDTKGAVPRDLVVRQLLNAIDPNLADQIPPADVMEHNEVQDEELNFMKIAVGLEPPMAPEGQNFPLRLQWNVNQAKKNPASIEQLSPKSKEIWETRVKHLQFMTTQIQNAQTGRVGAQPALQG